MDLKIKINRDTSFHCDRSLDSTKYRNATGFKPLPWDDMISELVADAAIYDKWRA